MSRGAEGAGEFEEQKKKAQRVARIMRRQARRPFVLEITGTPKAGKTTLIGMLEGFLRDCGWKVHVLRERAGECPLPMKGHFFFNTWTMGTMLAGLLDAVDREHDLVILDRGIFDSLIWLEMQHGEGQVSEDEYGAFRRFVGLERWRRLVDAVALIQVDARTAMDRENAARLLPRTGSVMKPERLQQFNEALEALTTAHKEQFVFHRIQNAHGAKAGALELVEKVLDAATLFADPEIAVLSREDAEALVPRSSAAWCSDLWDDLERRVVYRKRSSVEDDDAWVQLLACGAQVHEGEVFLIVRRPRRDDVTRPRDNSAMLWRGCHVTRPKEGPLRGALDEQLMHRLRSELHLGQLASTPQPLGMIWNREGTEPRHLGVVFRVPVPPHVAAFLDEKEFKTNGRGHLLHSSFVPPDALGGDTVVPRGYTLEEWSRLMLDEKWLP